MIKFKYRKEKGRKGEIYRPVADVEFQSKTEEWIECHLYIDSGADVSLIPLSLGKLLKLKVEKEKIKELRGLGKQSIPVVFQDIKVRIGIYKFAIEVGWSLIENVPPLLGRKDIFY